MCAVANMAVFCNSLTSCFPGMLLLYFLNDIIIIIIIIIFNRWRNYFCQLRNVRWLKKNRLIYSWAINIWALFFQGCVCRLKVEEVCYQALINTSRTNPDRGWNIIFCDFTNLLIVFEWQNSVLIPINKKGDVVTTNFMQHISCYQQVHTKFYSTFFSQDQLHM